MVERRHDDERTGSDGRSGVILGGKDVAGGPAHLSTQLHQGLDQNRGLDRHVQGAGNAGTLEGLLTAVLLAKCHQTGHLGLSDVEFLATEIGLSDISNDEVIAKLQLSWRRGRCHHGFAAP